MKVAANLFVFLVLGAAGPAGAQDTGVITYTVERTIEPSDGGKGAEVTFHTEATITRDLSAKGQQGYEIDAERIQTVVGKDGDAVVIRQEIYGRDGRDVTVERITTDRMEQSERPDNAGTIERPERPRR